MVIIGGGPGGTACALALQRMAAEIGRKIKITLVEGKQFVGEMHYNQCVGCSFASPCQSYYRNRLGVRFPYRCMRSVRSAAM